MKQLLLVSAALLLAACDTLMPNQQPYPPGQAYPPAYPGDAYPPAPYPPGPDNSAPNPYPPAPYPPAPYPPGPQLTCPITTSSEWRAWVNAMPRPNARPKLIVTGKVVTPTGGYQISFDPYLQVRRSYPVQAFATLRVTPPAGPATQALVAHDVRWEWPMNQPVGSVEVRCGDQTLARISPVETAH